MLGRFAASVQQLSRATESVLQFCVSMRPNDARSHCAGTSEVPSLRAGLFRHGCDYCYLNCSFLKSLGERSAGFLP